MVQVAVLGAGFMGSTHAKAYAAMPDVEVAAIYAPSSDRGDPLAREIGSRWTDEATRAGRRITRVCVAFEAGRDGFWLARWLRARGVEAHVIHPTSVAV